MSSVFLTAASAEWIALQHAMSQASHPAQSYTCIGSLACSFNQHALTAHLSDIVRQSKALSVLQIHWFSIINSCVTVLLLTGFLATILMRVLRKDFVKYTRDDEQGAAMCMLHASNMKFDYMRLCLLLSVACTVVLVVCFVPSLHTVRA